MRTENLVIYHADCPDGFGAAYAAWRHFGATASYSPAQYGRPIARESLIGRRVFVFDFSFSPAELMAMAEAAE